MLLYINQFKVFYLKYEVLMSKSKILNIYKNVDTWFWISGSINPYRGCEHACIYCDGQANHYNISEYTTHIRIKKNAPELLNKELIKLGFRPINRYRNGTILHYFPEKRKIMKPNLKAPLFAIGGGICDVYQPAEKKFKITRKLLQIMLDFGLPLFILTKSDLILRDIDLIQKFKDMSYVNIAFTITLMDEKIQKLIEPKSSTTSERFGALKKFSKLGCTTGIMAMPILPGIGDTTENIEGIISKAADIGVNYILFSGLTLKPGNREIFLKFIYENFPYLSNLYKKMYLNADQYGNPIITHDYERREFMKIAHNLCKKYGILDRMPRYIPELSNKTNLRISEILNNIIYLKRWVYRVPPYKLKKFITVANLIEHFPKDLKDFSRDRLKKNLHIDDKLTDIVFEIIQTNKSKF